MWNIAFYLTVVTIAVLLRFGAFIVYEGSQVIVTQFGAIVGSEYENPGLYFRLPLIQKTNYFDMRIRTWHGKANYMPTKDRLYVGVETVAHWRISDPGRFLEIVNTEKVARERLESILTGAVKDVIAANALVDTVRSTNNVIANRGKAERIGQADLTDGMNSTIDDSILSDLELVNVGRVHLSEKILEAAADLADPLGIEILAVYLKRISYSPPVERMVFERMISERERVAERLRSIGRSESERIRGAIAKGVQEIVSPAVREAEMIKGEAEAEATRVYAESFGKDPEFFRFWRTLDTYRSALPERAEIIASLDSAFFKLLRDRENGHAGTRPDLDELSVKGRAALPDLNMDPAEVEALVGGLVTLEADDSGIEPSPMVPAQ